MIDDFGITHQPTTGPARIVSLVPSITELLCDLQLERQLVGRTNFCIHPRKRVKMIPSLGGTKKINLERLRALKPTHVILNIDENTRQLFDDITRFIPTVVVTHPNRPGDNLRLFRLLGGIFHQQQAAEHLCRQFEEAYASLLQASVQFQERKVIYLIWQKPWMTVSRETYISQMLALVHWHTLPVDATVRYPEIDISQDLLNDTELILFSSEPYAFNQRDLALFQQRYHCDRIPLRLIDGSMTSWYGSRSIKGLGYLRDLAQDLQQIVS